jgi:AraC family transcriptional regulator of adaptative response/methylated-DNA-[protein]-cysteine methyltransferase
VSPKQYADARRVDRLRAELRDGTDVTSALYNVGFGSSSRLYERVDTRLGMTPSAYRAGGTGVGITCATAETPLGLLMMGATDRGLCFVQFGASHDSLLATLRREYPAAAIDELRKPYPPPFERWMGALVAHLAEARDSLDLPLDVRATAFQLKVWRYLQTIRPGQVESYEEVARGIGRPGAARAVAGACAANQVALVIPCHRVIRGDGSLGGYKWGLDRKRTLLDRERHTGARRSSLTPLDPSPSGTRAAGGDRTAPAGGRSRQ